MKTKFAKRKKILNKSKFIITIYGCNLLPLLSKYIKF